MDLLVIILNKVEFLNDILQLMVEAGIANATIFDSEGVGHYLAYEVPVFAGLRSIIGKEKEHNKTILALLEKKGSYDEFENLLKKENIDFSKTGMGIIFSISLKTVIKADKEIL